MKQCGMSCIFAFVLAVGAVGPIEAQTTVPRSLGEVEVLSGPSECEGRQCYWIRVTCPEVSAPARARLVVGEADPDAERGTVILTSGGGGTGLYESRSGRSPIIVDGLRTSGFATVQLQWIDSWSNGTRGEDEGSMRLACRSATVARWVHDNIHQQSPDAGFCASGHSGGSTQVSYMLSHYGLEDILDAVVPTGGPPHARLDLSCMMGIHMGPTLAGQDAAFGYPADGSGPCSSRDPSHSEMLRLASVASGEGDYLHPQTMVSFVFEEIDNAYAVAKGMTYHHLLVKTGSPFVETITIPNVTHFGPDGLYNSEEGVTAIRDILIKECRPRTP